jgi:Skp family chaperone for outer membrane proteins
MADELQTRMKGVEQEVRKLQTDFKRIEGKFDKMEKKLDKLILSLTGDDISEGALKSMSKRIAEQEKDLNNISKSVVKLTQSALTPEEHKGIKDLLSMFRGWKLLVGLAIYLIPLITFIMEKVFK